MSDFSNRKNRASASIASSSPAQSLPIGCTMAFVEDFIVGRVFIESPISDGVSGKGMVLTRRAVPRPFFI